MVEIMRQSSIHEVRFPKRTGNKVEQTSLEDLCPSDWVNLITAGSEWSIPDNRGDCI